MEAPSDLLKPSLYLPVQILPAPFTVPFNSRSKFLTRKTKIFFLHFTETEPTAKPVYEPVRPAVKNDPETVSNTKINLQGNKTHSSHSQVIKQNLDNARNGLLLLQLEPQSRQQLEYFLHRQLIEEEELHVRHYNELQKFLNACK